MREEIKSLNDWSAEFDQIRQSITKTRTIFECLTISQMSSEMLEAIKTLENELEIIKKTSDNLQWYFCMGPLEKWNTGKQMTREDFYLLAAQGILVIHSSVGSGDAYWEFSQYLYEDNERMGYINPFAQKNPPPIPDIKGGWTQEAHFKIGVLPEDVRIDFLRTEQKAFFKEFEPELFSRFRND